jgi:electron transport complex protein RnfC
MKFKTFPRGGVHPADSKAATSALHIENASFPSLAIVPMLQHLGAPAECLVNPGDRVEEGQLIGKSTGFVSANVHSPIPGVVQEIKDVYLPSGIKSKAVFIKLEGEFNRSGKLTASRNWQHMDKDALNAIIIDKGIVGLGGATFPTHVKFNLPKGAKAESFVVNGTECEPFLTADHRTMLERSKEIIEGIEIIQKILGNKKSYIGIEENKLDAINVMKVAAAICKVPLEVVPLHLKYPQGDEKQLLKAVIGQEVPSGKLPIDIGAVVANVGTVTAIHDAVILDKPLIERVVTVSGSAIRHPKNLKVRIGTPVSALIEECGGLLEVPDKIVIGGPMMGFAIYDLDIPVTKGTSGVLALTAAETKNDSRSACLSCGRCVEACPMGLDPTSLFKAIDHDATDMAINEGLMDCKECGCCAFSCPAHIPLVQGFRLGKKLSRMKKAK